MNKNKRNTKRITLTSLLIIIFTLILFISSYVIDTKKFYSKHKNYSEDYLLKVTYLTVDKDKIPDNVSMKDTFAKYQDDVLLVTNQVVPLEKDKEYLYANLTDFTNEILLKDITDYTFTKNNFNGEKIENCEIDLKKKQLKIPISYYNKKGEIPVQVEIESRVSKKEIKSVNVSTNIKDIFTKTKQTKANALTLQTSISLNEHKKYISKNDIELYLNNSDASLTDKDFEYDENKKEITIKIPSTLINNIDIRIKNSIIPKASAALYSSVDPDDFNSIELSRKPTNISTDTISVGTSDYYYCTTSDTCSVSTSQANYSYLYYKYNGTYHSSIDGSTIDRAMYIYPFAINLTNFNDIGISFPNITIPFYCYDHNTAAGGMRALNMKVDIVETGSNYYVLFIHSTNYTDTQSAYAYIKVSWPEEKEYYLYFDKTSEENISMDNIEYTITSGTTLMGTAVLDSTGKIKSIKNAISNDDYEASVYTATDGKKYMKILDKTGSESLELTTKESYVPGTINLAQNYGTYTFTMSSDGLSNAKLLNKNASNIFYNNKSKGMIEIYKYDTSTGVRVGIPNIVFKLSGNGITPKTIKTNSFGYVREMGLSDGTYTVEELGCSGASNCLGYAPVYDGNGNKYTVTINTKGRTFSYNGSYIGYSFDAVEYKRITQSSAIQAMTNLEAFEHYVSSGSSDAEQGDGAYQKRMGADNFSAREYLDKNSDLASNGWDLMSDAQKAAYKNHKYLYVTRHYSTNGVNEGRRGRKDDYYKSLNVGVNSDNSVVVSLAVPNNKTKGMIEIYKYDNSTNTHEPITSPAKFTVKKVNDCTNKVVDTSFAAKTVTTTDGYAIIPDLTNGYYTVQETENPEGYELNDSIYCAHIDTDAVVRETITDDSTANVEKSRGFYWNGIYMGYAFDAYEYAANYYPSDTGLSQHGTNYYGLFGHYMNYGAAVPDHEQGAYNFNVSEYYNRYKAQIDSGWNSVTDKSKFNNNENIYALYHYVTIGVPRGYKGRADSYYKNLSAGISDSDNDSISVAVAVPNNKNANKGALKIQKVFTDDSNEFSKVRFKITDILGHEETIAPNSEGYACYGYENNATCSGDMNLDAGSSYIIEEIMDNDLQLAYTVDYENLGAVIDAGGGEKEVTFTNTPKKYCVKVKKIDAEDEYESTPMNGFTFKIQGDDSGSTATGQTEGSVIYFTNLDYEDYTLTETNSDGTNGYWNDTEDGKNTIIVAKEDLTLMENGRCPSNVRTFTKPDHKQYYCIKVKKVDQATNQPIKGAMFRINQGEEGIEHADDWDGREDGYTTFFMGNKSGMFDVIETRAPEGYSLYSGTLKATANLLSREISEQEALEECKNADPATFEATSIPTFPDSKETAIWYKETENGSAAKGAEFEVKNGDSVVYHAQEKISVTDSNGITKSCYVYSPTSTGDNSNKFISDANGEVCITNIEDSTYTVTETKPAKYHTFDSVNTKTITSSETFTLKTNSNKFVNRPTSFEFEKKVSSGDDSYWKTITTSQLKKIPFNIFDANNNKLSFILKDGVYQYAGNDIDNVSGTPVQDLFLSDNRKFRVEHLPVGTYSVKEKGATTNNGTCVCEDGNNCIGFYYPNYTNESDYKFTITNCSNDNANSDKCAVHKTVTQSLINKPTEIKFTKSDLYGYEDANDVVDFENDQERNDFDKILFKMKDANGNYLKFIKVGNNGTCKTDDSYAEYRYVSDEYLSLLTAEERQKVTENLYTCGGHIRITHLCRGKKYYIEEVSVPDNSVFTLPEKLEDRIREYNIPCCDGDTTSTSTTTIINDKPTRVRFEKRDSKYNYLIPDETTTFKVYQCKNNTNCHPALGVTSNMKLMKFSPRSVIRNDEEDPSDAAGLAGVEVYRAMSDSDIQSGQTSVTELHPYHGILVLRYLPAGYKYVLVETKAPKNYKLPEGTNAETHFTVVNDTVSALEVDMPNVPTSLLIRKYSDDGKLLSGAQFKIYEADRCDSNISPMTQTKREIKLKTIRDGLYEARPEEDTNIIQTCSDKNGTCKSIPIDQSTKLTYTNYLGTWADFEEEKAETREKIEMQEGEALIQYLEYGKCYIIEEVKAPEGYSLPEKEEDRYTMVKIEENERYAKDTYKQLVNTPTPFTFYKYDEYNKLIDGAEFKLQKLNKDKKYEDVTVRKEEKNGEYYYKADKMSENTKIETKEGKATVYYLTSGQYRIIETKAAEGKELGKNPNVATFFVDDSGNVYGNSIIVNKGKTEKIEIKGTSSAEFIISPRTGQTVVRYGVIITILVGIIAGLMIIRKKTK